MTGVRALLTPVCALALAGCAMVQKTPPYEGPFHAGSLYVADAPLSARVGDRPLEEGAALGQELDSPVRAVRDPVVLFPGTRLEFVRKDDPFLVFLITAGEQAGRYAWIQQFGEDVEHLSPLVETPP